MKPTVALCYTHGESVKSVFMAALIHNVIMDDRSAKHIGAVFGQGGGALIANTRNKAVKCFLEEIPSELEWLWFIDADMQPGWFTLPDLLDAVSGVWRDSTVAKIVGYDDEGALGPCVASAATRSQLQHGRSLTWSVRDANDVQCFAGEPVEHVTELDACGMACTLIHRDVLLAVYEANKDDPWPWFAHDIEGDVRLGEDFTFCRRAKAAGFKVFGVDTQVPHHKLLPV